MGQFFFSFFSQYFHWPAKASQVCAISQCQRLSVRLIQLRLRQLQRERVTGVSLIFPIGFVPFVFSARVSSLPATCSGKTINCPCPDQLLGKGHCGPPIGGPQWPISKVISKYIAHFGMRSYPCVCACVSVEVKEDIG